MARLKSFVAMAGLAGVGWIAYTVVQGEVSLMDAGIRAAAVLGAVMVVTMFIGFGARMLAASLERA